MERTCRQIRFSGGRSIFCLLILAMTTGCTMLHKIPLEPEEITRELEPGDQVHIVTKDGQDIEFVLTSVSQDKLAGESQSVEIMDIAKVEKREISVLKTSGAVVGSVLAYVGAAFILILLSL